MNTIKVTCENPDELIAGFGAGARIKIQSGATQNGAFSDLTTITLVAATRVYTYEHLGGTSSTWYQFRFEDSTGANANDYSASFQVGDETAGLLCSVYDVLQELGDPNGTSTDVESVLEKIRQVSWAIEHVTGRWLAPRPTNPATDMTLLFDVPWVAWAYPLRSLLLDYGNRLTGIRRLTTVEIATTSQPETGGTYGTAVAADFLMRPRPSAEAPALRLEVTPFPTGTPNLFYPGYNTLRLTGGFGPAAVPYDVQGVAIRAATRRYIGKSGGGAAVAIGPNGTEILLPDLSGADQRTLELYRLPLAG